MGYEPIGLQFALSAVFAWAGFEPKLIKALANSLINPPRPKK